MTINLPHPIPSSMLRFSQISVASIFSRVLIFLIFRNLPLYFFQTLYSLNLFKFQPGKLKSIFNPIIMESQRKYSFIIDISKIRLSIPGRTI